MFNKTLFALLFLISIVGCSDKPGKSILQTELQKNLKTPWIIESLNIAAEEDIGSKTKPSRKYRLVVDISPSEALYKKIGGLMNVPVLIKSRKKDAEKTFHVIATSVYRNGEWSFSFMPESNPYNGEGVISSHWSKEYVIKGTSEHNTLVDNTYKQIREDREKVILIDNEISSIKVKYKSELLKYNEKKEEAKLKIHEAKIEKDKQVKELRKQVSQEFDTKYDNAKQTKNEKFTLVKNVYNEKKSTNNSKYKVENSKLKAQLDQVYKIKSQEMRQFKNLRSQQLSEGRKKLSKAQYKEFLIEKNNELSSKVRLIEKKYNGARAPIKAQQQLNNKRREIDKGPYTEYKSNLSKINTEFDLELKQFRLKLKQQENKQKTKIENPYIALKAKLEEELQPYKSAVKLLDNKTLQLKNERNTLTNNIRNNDNALAL